MSLEPDRATLERWLASASRYVLDHIDAIGHGRASGPIGAEGLAIAADVSVPIPEEPLGDLDAILPRLDRAVEAALRPNGPGYLAYIPGGGLPAAAIADLL